MSKIPCEMIQDLLPSYIDELTSEVTNREVESHVSECGQCKKVLDEMSIQFVKALVYLAIHFKISSWIA